MIACQLPGALRPIAVIAMVCKVMTMWGKKKPKAEPIITPEPGEIDEAARNPGGWVYRISGNYGPNDGVPAEAIIGAWKVADNGLIGTFMPNPNFDPSSDAANRP